MGFFFVSIVFGETPKAKDARMAWWREAHFGLFIHWGLYAILAGEYQGKTIPGTAECIMNTAQIPVSEYEKLAKAFNPVRFNAEEWVTLAKEAGMRYLVVTAKHHDGFCLWDSKVTTYDIVDRTPFKRDVIGELSEACKRAGIRFCVYYSIMDWHHPDAQGQFYPDYNNTESRNPNFPRYVSEYLKPQLRELITQYSPLGVLWFDGEWIPDWTETLGKEIYDYCRSLQPDLIINNRVGKTRMGMQGFSRDPNTVGDYGTPEQEIPATGLVGVDWESCMPMNDTWGYKISDSNWKSSQQLLQNLVDIVSKGGNYLLNVGPKADGTIPTPSVERLKTIGEWMQRNGEAIYGTTATPFKYLPWGEMYPENIRRNDSTLFSCV